MVTRMVQPRPAILLLFDVGDVMHSLPSDAVTLRVIAVQYWSKCCGLRVIGAKKLCNQESRRMLPGVHCNVPVVFPGLMV